MKNSENQEVGHQKYKLSKYPLYSKLKQFFQVVIWTEWDRKLTHFSPVSHFYTP